MVLVEHQELVFLRLKAVAMLIDCVGLDYQHHTHTQCFVIICRKGIRVWIFQAKGLQVSNLFAGGSLKNKHRCCRCGAMSLNTSMGL